MSPLFPSLTGIFEQLDGQRLGPSLYDLVENTRFVRKPRERSFVRDGSAFVRVVYESVCSTFRYMTEVCPNKWSTFGEKLEMTVKEPILQNKQYVHPPVCESIFTFTAGGHDVMWMQHDLRQGKYLTALVPSFKLERSRSHEWNYCWTKENPKTFFDRGEFDEIWKAMMLLKVSIDRTDEALKMRNRWWSRQTVSTTLFRRHLHNGDRKPYVA